MAEKADVVLIGVPKKHIVDGLSAPFNLHVIPKDNAEAIIAKVAPNVRGAAVTGAPDKMMGDMMARFPKLEFVSSFGVGYDHIDVKYAVEHGITVTNTPEVLNRGGRRHRARPAAVHRARIPAGRTSCAPANGWSGSIR